MTGIAVYVPDFAWMGVLPENRPMQSGDMVYFSSDMDETDKRRRMSR